MMWFVFGAVLCAAIFAVVYAFVADGHLLEFLPQRLLGFTAAIPSTPVTIARWEENVRQAATDAGWVSVPDRLEGLCFQRSHNGVKIQARVMRHRLYTVYRMDCELVLDHAPPPNVQASFVSPIDLLEQLLRDVPAETRGRISYGEFRLTDANLEVLWHCFDRERLASLSSDREALLKSFEIEDQRIRLGFGFRHGEDVSDVVGRERAWEKTFQAYGRTLETVIEMGHALRWDAEDVDQLLDRILLDPGVDAGLWRAAAALEMRPMSPQDRAAWLAEQTVDPSATRERWIACVPDLLQQDTSHPAMERVFLHALEPGNEALLGTIARRDYALVMERMRTSPVRARWLVALLRPDVGLLESQRRSMIAMVDPSLVLSDELDIHSRGVLLSGILSMGDASQTQELVYTLLRGNDDEALVEIMTTLSVYANADVARSVASFVSNPDQVDTQREYQALLTLLKALAKSHPAEIMTPDVERFLCHCITHADERIASMALALVSDFGDEPSLEALQPLLGSTDLAIPQASIGRAMRNIRVRLGEDMAVFSGGLSIAQGSGGELTAVADAGAISMSE